MSEANIVRRITTLLNRRGAWYVKTHGTVTGRTGIPDILACYRGHFIALEVKQPGRKATPLQQHELGQLKQAEAAAQVVTDPDQVSELLDSIDRYQDAIDRLREIGRAA